MRTVSEFWELKNGKRKTIYKKKIGQQETKFWQICRYFWGNSLRKSPGKVLPKQAKKRQKTSTLTKNVEN